MTRPNYLAADQAIHSHGTDTLEVPETQDRSPSGFLRTLFRLLDENQIRYCVLHSWEGLPEKLSSDLDIGVHPQDCAKLPFVFRTLMEDGYRPVQCLNYYAKAFYFVFLWFEGIELRSLALDIIFEHRRSGLISLRGEELLAGRMRRGDFWVAGPQVEFTYLLAKRTSKGSVSPRQACRFKLLVELLGSEQAERSAGKIFLGGLKTRVVDACVDGSINEFLRRLRRQPWCTSLVQNPVGLVRFLLGEAVRIVRRSIHPTGLFVVILGPDGVGKSSLAVQLTQALGPCFRRQRIHHWRPMVIASREEIGEPAINPHGQTLRGPWLSIAVLLGILADYWLGYGFVLRPFLVRTGLVIFDRYYWDLLIDPTRYRYGGPIWVAKLFGHFLPRPDLLHLVLDAEDEVIVSRKHEVHPEELRRQRQGYQQHVRDVETAKLIKTDQGIELTVGQAARFVVEHLVQRFEHRNARWLATAR